MDTYSGDTDVKEPIILTEIKPMNVPDVRRRLIDRKEEESNVESNNGIDVSLYSTKKNIAQGMLDLSLISANCSQLKYLLYHYDKGRAGSGSGGVGTGQESSTNNNNKDYDYYFIINLSCIAVSIGLQVLVGLLLIINVRHNITVQKYLNIADTYSNLILVGVFLITVINIFLSVFISAK